jgi:hypothetical protein
MTIAIIIILFSLLVYLFILRKPSSTSNPSEVETEVKRNYSGIGTYSRERLKIELTGGNHYAETINTLANYTELIVKFEPNNAFDKNAICCYTLDGRKVGYIPRNQRKIIKTLRENPNCYAYLYGKRKYNGKLYVEIELLLNFPEVELKEERDKDRLKGS